MAPNTNRQSAEIKYLLAEHPEVGQRWANASAQGGSQHFSRSPKSDSEEVNKPGVSRTPRLPGAKRDFQHLVPNQVARHKPKAANEKEAMQEGKTESYPGSRHNEMSIVFIPSKFQGRDIKTATRGQNG